MNTIVPVLQQTPNANFQEAVKYFFRNYAYLIRESYIKNISLLDAGNHQPGAEGLHRWYGTYAEITVRNSTSYSVPFFVEILVHELTHLVQCSSGRARNMTTEQLEAEAYPAGRTARKLYELQTIEQLASEMKAATTAARLRAWRAA